MNKFWKLSTKISISYPIPVVNGESLQSCKTGLCNPVKPADPVVDKANFLLAILFVTSYNDTGFL